MDSVNVMPKKVPDDLDLWKRVKKPIRTSPLVYHKPKRKQRRRRR